MDFIYSELDTALLNVSPDTEKDIFYYGTMKSFPSISDLLEMLPNFQSDRFTGDVLDYGAFIHLNTDGKGEYEIIFYPATYGEIVYLDQNSIGINLINGWEQEHYPYRGMDFVICYTKNLQYSDSSDFLFKFENSF